MAEYHEKNFHFFFFRQYINAKSIYFIYAPWREVIFESYRVDSVVI